MREKIARGSSFIVVLCAASAAFSVGAQTQEHFRPGAERWEHRQLVFDNRFQHARYYPAVGFVAPALPPGSTAITFGNVRFYFHSGVWYRSGPSGYLVARPPVGIVIPVLPPGYTVVPVAGASYYYANDTYYAPAAGGYAVVQAPAAGYVEAPATGNAPMPRAAPSAAPAMAPSAPANVWYYCESAQNYYPYVRDCREGWRPVPAVPPGH